MNVKLNDDRPTPTIENYLKAIRTLENEDGLVRPTAIADAMRVSGPTVTVTLRRVEDAGWVERVGRQVRLTPEGRAHASSVTHRRDVGEAFLERVLGLPHDLAEQEACALEHALSPRTVDALEKQLLLHTENGSPHPQPREARRTP